MAVALFCVFLALCLVAPRRGQQAVGLASLGSIVLLLLSGSDFAGTLSRRRPRWVLPLLVSLLASLSMMRRLLSGTSLPALRPADRLGLRWPHDMSHVSHNRG